MRDVLAKVVGVALVAVCAATWILPEGVGVGSYRLGGTTVVEVAPPLNSGTPWAASLAPEGSCPGDAAPSEDLARQTFAVRCLLDWARRQRGLPALPMSPPLNVSARLKAEAIIRCNQFSHTPCGRPFGETFAAAGWYGSSGENIAWGPSLAGSPRVLVDGWLHSTGHRENLFRGEWRVQGLACVRAAAFLGQKNASICVHQFGA